MNSNILIDVALVVLVLVRIGYSQLTWRPVDPRNMLRLPGILLVVGAFMLANSGALTSVSSIDIAALTVGIVLSLGVGAAMGRIAAIRPLTSAGKAHANEKTVTESVLETRTGWLGIALWALLIVARVGVDLWASALGSHLAVSTGLIMIFIAANRAARVAVIIVRAGRLAPVAA